MQDHLARPCSIRPTDVVSQYEAKVDFSRALYRKQLGLINFVMLCMKLSTPFKPFGCFIYYKYEQVKLFRPTAKKTKQKPLQD